MIYRIILALCGAVIARAELRLAPIFTDHMVLQRDQPVPIWGRASPDARVVVEFNGETQIGVADEMGRWLIRLAARAALAEPSTLRVSSATESRVLTDVLVGEVWLCAGQSNMEWPLEKEAHAIEELSRAAHPAIRLFNPDYAGKEAGGNPFTAAEVARLTPEGFFHGAWMACTPATAARFSAIGYYFAQVVHTALGVPIGVINLAVGGSPAEAWMRSETLAADPELRLLAAPDWLTNPALEAWCLQRTHENLDRAIAAGEVDAHSPNHAFKPGFLWTAALEPLAPFAIRGVLWYQGESNSLRADRVREHEKLLPILVRDWRTRWGLGDLPFYYCQLSGIETKSYHSEFWPDFRDGQRRLLAVIPNSGMVVTSDVGDPASVHPRDKLTVGTRLARLALARCYGHDLESSGPSPRSVTAHERELTVEFDHTDDRLRTSDDRSPTGFEIAAVDGDFSPANARLTGSTVTLFSQGVVAPRRVRYGWTPFSVGNLINSAGLPTSTFAMEVRPAQEK
jgi:sialate O-acetylesterase